MIVLRLNPATAGNIGGIGMYPSRKFRAVLINAGVNYRND